MCTIMTDGKYVMKVKMLQFESLFFNHTQCHTSRNCCLDQRLYA